MTVFSNSGLICGCAVCAQQGFLDSGASSAPYTLGTAPGISHPLKWGPSDTLGTSGGVVTWSIVAGNNAIDPSFLDPGDPSTTTSLSSFLYSGFEQQLRAAFAAWSAVANINFIQVTDGGGAVGNDTTGNFADIRILAVPFDGPNGTLALTFFPDQGSIGGDMILDSTDGAFFDAHSLFLVAAHEIGHAIGLDHADPNTNPGSLMNGIYNDSLNGLQADDINGAQAIYGAAQAGASKVYDMPNGQNNLTILTGIPNLLINGNNAVNNITGSSANEFFYGGGGDDVIRGGAGDDWFYASLLDGNDSYSGGDNWDIIDYSGVAGVVSINQLEGYTSGSAGVDILIEIFEQIVGSQYNDVLSGNHGINCIDGNGGDDLIWGNNGDDLVRGGPGNDSFYCSMGDGDDRIMGGDGWDHLDYSALGGVVQINMLSGTTSGSAGNDTLMDLFEEVSGTAYNDTISGSHSGETINGNGGNDQIWGNGGDDVIRAGTGNDTVVLGAGNDTFVFTTGGGADTITDFVAGAGSDDVINVHSLAGFTSFAQVQAVTSQVGADTVINFGGGNQITLLSVTASNLHQDDFTFV